MAISIFIVALMLRPVPHTTLTPNLINLNPYLTSLTIQQRRPTVRQPPPGSP
jgi:hypothetical protein